MVDGIDTSVLPELPRKTGKRRGNRFVSAEERALKTSPEWKEQLAQHGFQKGRKKTGGRKATPKETKEWIAGKSIDVAEFMYNAMNDETQPLKERIKAAQWLGDMSMSRAPTESTVKVDHTYNIGNMLLEAQKLASLQPPMKDITPVEIIDATPKLSVRSADND
jgi:hypothetical protein